MKIAFDSQIFSAQKYGGISRYICEIASRLSKMPGVDVSVVAPMSINAYLERLPKEIVSGFRAPNTANVRLRMLFRAMGLLIGDWMLRAKAPDIVHETYFSPYRFGLRRSRRVLTIYDMIPEKFAADFPLAEKMARHKALAAKRADHVICISETTRRDVIEILGLPPEKISVIYLGFDLMGSDHGATELPDLPTATPFLLYVGNRGGYKNFHRLLEAYGSSSWLRTNYKLICFGGGEFRADELFAMDRLGLNEGQVIQLGGDDQVLAKLYVAASVFVFPSLYEGFGIPPLEAMAHDCPVVCSDQSSIPEVVGDAGEYFDPSSSESMRAAIELVLQSDEHRKNLIERGRARLECFSWDRCAEETLDVYMKLV